MLIVCVISAWLCPYCIVWIVVCRLRKRKFEVSSSNWMLFLNFTGTMDHSVVYDNTRRVVVCRGEAVSSICLITVTARYCVLYFQIISGIIDWSIWITIFFLYLVPRREIGPRGPILEVRGMWQSRHSWQLSRRQKPLKEALGNSLPSDFLLLFYLSRQFSTSQA